MGQCLLCPIPLIPHSDSGALEGWITLPTVTMVTTVLGGLELARTTDRNSPGRYYTGNVLHAINVLENLEGISVGEQNDRLFNVTNNISVSA